MGKGGGGSAPAPSQQTVTQTSIPEYARPYVENMLGKTEALTDISKNPYQAYQGQRIAGFAPMQQQSFENIQNMQTPGQFQTGTQMAGIAGLGGLGAQRQYQNMATNPNAVGAYMSPFMQNVVDVQKQEAVRDYGKKQVGQNLSAARQGTYGGARQLLASTEANRNLQNQLAQIQAQGSQAAYDQAQKNLQYGADLGIRGLGVGLQGATTLGQLGSAQQQSAENIAKMQQAAGATQQAQDQRILEQQYSDFQAQRAYPYQQLGFMSDALRGLPLSQASQQLYQAPPSIASQIGGMGLAGLSLYNLTK
jgi:hypothetical protein